MFVNHVKNNPETYKECDAYVKSIYMKDALNKITLKLGLDKKLAYS